MKYLLILLILSFNLNAQFIAKFGGWSKHSAEGYGIDNKRPYTENHKGLGIDYHYGDGDLKVISGLWYMKDSYNNNSYQAGVGVSYDLNKYLTVNLALTYLNRTYIQYNKDYENEYNSTYDGAGFVIDRVKVEPKDGEVYSISRAHFIYPLPYLTVNFTNKLNMDAMFLPSSFGDVSVTFIRLGYKF